jgi:aflatoxin B1 aldehyde reductase
MATTPNGLKLIYGAGGLSPGLVGEQEADAEFHEYAKQILEVLEKEGISNLDTAEIYPGSEEEIGYHGAANRFTIDTKLPGAFGDARQKDEIIAGGKASLEKLKTKQVHSTIFLAPV